MKVVVVGYGVSGATAVRTISELTPEIDVSTYTDENHPYYPRPRLYEVISGQHKPEEICVFPQQLYDKPGITIHLKKKVSSIDPDQKRVGLEDGSSVNYDKLLLANGARPFVPPITGVRKKGVFTLRTIADALAIREYAKKTDRAIIIGGGLLGLEFAACLRNAGQKVEVVEINPRLLPNQLDQDGARILEEDLKLQGINVELNVRTTEIVGTDAVSGVLLDNGKKLEGDLVLIAAGIKPNIDLAASAGIRTNKGVIVDQLLQTSTEDVYAAGDVSEFNGTVYGTIPPAVEQAKIASVNIVGKEKRFFRGMIPSTTLKVANIELASMGLVNPQSSRYEQVKMANRGTYKKIVLDQGRIVGAIMLGDKRGAASIKKLMDQEVDVTRYKDHLLDDDFDIRRIASKTS